MNDSSQFSIDSSGQAQVSGALTLDTVTALYHKANTETARGLHIKNIDLAAVSRVDSSGLALLLEWQSAAVHSGRALNIFNAPADLLSLVSLCEASDLLTIVGKNHTPAKEILPTHTNQLTHP